MLYSKEKLLYPMWLRKICPTVLNLSSQFPSPDDDHEHDDRDTVDDEEAEAAAALPEARGQVPRDQDSLDQNQGTGCPFWSKTRFGCL